MSEEIDVHEKFIALLREGKVQEADDLARAHLDKLKADEAAAAGASPPPAPPRTLGECLNDFFVALIQHLGNRPDLATLLVELQPLLAKLDAPSGAVFSHPAPRINR